MTCEDEQQKMMILADIEILHGVKCNVLNPTNIALNVYNVNYANVN